jgi:hypothetical protein
MSRTGEELIQVSIRVRKSDWQRLDALARKTPLPRGTIARQALRLGLDELAKDWTRAFLLPPDQVKAARP